MSVVGTLDNSDSLDPLPERRIGIAELDEARESTSPPPPPEPPEPNAIHAAAKPSQRLFFWVNQFQFLMVIGMFGLVLQVGWLILVKTTNWIRPSILAGINANRLTAFVVLGLVVAALVIAIVYFTKRGSKQIDSTTYPQITNAAFRLRLIGRESHAKAIVDALTPNANFEPVIIRLWYGHARESDKVTKHGQPEFFHQGGVSPKVWAISTFVTVGAMVLASWSMGWKLIKLDMWTVWAGMGLVTVIATWIKPSYLRIAPGRLDVMEFGAMGLGKVKCDTYDLRSAKIAINIAIGVARIEDCSEAKQPVLHLRPAMIVGDSTKWLRHAADQAWVAILNAARTDVPTPPLPDDELLG